MNKMKTRAGSIIAAIAVLFFLGFGITTVKTTPENAMVFIDAVRKTYKAPACIPMAEWPSTDRMTIQQARQNHLAPDDDCRNMSGFAQDGRSLSGLVLESVGVLPEIPSRWNADGSWNW